MKQEFTARAGSVFWSAHTVDLASQFDTVLVIDGERLVAQGKADDLAQPGGALAGLLAAAPTGDNHDDRTAREAANAVVASAGAEVAPGVQK